MSLQNLAVPLVQHFLDQIFVLSKPEANWSFVGSVSRIALHLQLIALPIV